MFGRNRRKDYDVSAEAEQEYTLVKNDISEEDDEYYDDYYDDYDIGYYEEYDEEYEAYLRFRRRKVFKIILAVISVILVLSVAVQGAMGVVLCNFVLESGNLARSEKASEIIIAPLSNTVEKQWLEKNGTLVETDGEEGHILKALRVDNYITAHSYVVLCHPVTADASDMARFACHYYELGFNVVIPYMRGCGESDYDTLSMGVYDSKDILRWVNMIIAEDNEAQIFLHGLGIGGSAVLMASAEQMPSNVKGIIADSSYADLEDLFEVNCEKMYDLPSFPAVKIGGIYLKNFAGWSFADGNVTEKVKSSKVPILLFHGGDDNIVPVSHGNELYEALPVEGSDHVLISGAAHCQCLNKNPDKYWRNVDAFILSAIAI